MRDGLTLTTPKFPQLILHSITRADLADLRDWKNCNRTSFFFQGNITASDQRRWYDQYLERDYDAMFIVVVAGERVGCMGARRVDTGSDLYNVIRARVSSSMPGAMGRAVRLLSVWASMRIGTPVGCLVLEDNPAIEWYERNGFQRVSAGGGSVHLIMDSTKVSTFPVVQLSIPSPTESSNQL